MSRALASRCLFLSYRSIFCLFLLGLICLLYEYCFLYWLSILDWYLFAFIFPFFLRFLVFLSRCVKPNRRANYDVDGDSRFVWRRRDTVIVGVGWGRICNVALRWHIFPICFVSLLLFAPRGVLLGFLLVILMNCDGITVLTFVLCLYLITVRRFLIFTYGKMIMVYEEFMVFLLCLLWFWLLCQFCLCLYWICFFLGSFPLVRSIPVEELYLLYIFILLTHFDFLYYWIYQCTIKFVLYCLKLYDRLYSFITISIIFTVPTQFRSLQLVIPHSSSW